MNTVESSKPNWKVIAASEGYKAFKKSYRKWLNYNSRYGIFKRYKLEYRMLFFQVIGTAFHFGKKMDVAPEYLLAYWTEKQDSNWHSYFREVVRKNKVPKANTKIASKYSVKLLKKHGYSPQRAFQTIRDDKRRLARELREKKGKKLRWSAAKKAAAKRSKYLKQKYSGN